jgi:hypothetical protein
LASGLWDNVLEATAEAARVARQLAQRGTDASLAGWFVGVMFFLVIGRALGRVDAALGILRGFLSAVPAGKAIALSAAILLGAAAAAGYAPQALEMLMASPAAEALEPLAVGLRIYLGESPLVAQEILEVGNDIAQHIRVMRVGFEDVTIRVVAPPEGRHTQ